MSKSKKKGWGLAALVVTIGGAALVMAGFGGNSSSSGGSGGGGGGGGGSGGGGSGGGGSGGGSGGGGNSDKPTPGPYGKGTVYGHYDPLSWPPDFDFNSNNLWISPDCRTVLEGELFRDDPAGSSTAIEPPDYEHYVPGRELEAVLAVDPNNTIAGLIDWIGNQWMAPSTPFALWAELQPINRGKSSRTMGITEEILRQASPVCAELPPAEWGPGLQAWILDMLVFVDIYTQYDQNDQIFDPDDDGTVGPMPAEA